MRDGRPVRSGRIVRASTRLARELVVIDRLRGGLYDQKLIEILFLR
jgi:hypothetical protein